MAEINLVELFSLLCIVIVHQKYRKIFNNL